MIVVRRGSREVPALRCRRCGVYSTKAEKCGNCGEPRSRPAKTKTKGGNT